MITVKETPEVIKILHFLNEIHINVIEKELEDATFLPGLAIASNCIEIDFDKLLYPGDILHEAGHLAVTTSEERLLIGTDSMPKEWPSPGDEIVSMLWSYAALHHLELPAEFVFHPNGYKNDSLWLIENYTNEIYIGLPLLEWMGLTLSKERASKEGKKPFPTMIKWLRD
jgi:hypothetical protein